MKAISEKCLKFAKALDGGGVQVDDRGVRWATCHGVS